MAAARGGLGEARGTARHAVALEEDALREPAVLLLGLAYPYRVVNEEVVNGEISDSEPFFGDGGNVFSYICIKFEDFSVQCHVLRCELCFI